MPKHRLTLIKYSITLISYAIFKVQYSMLVEHWRQNRKQLINSSLRLQLNEWIITAVSFINFDLGNVGVFWLLFIPPVQSKIAPWVPLSLLSQRRLFKNSAQTTCLYLPEQTQPVVFASFCLPKYSLERRWSSHTFRYGYLVTTSPQSPTLP